MVLLWACLWQTVSNLSPVGNFNNTQHSPKFFIDKHDTFIILVSRLLEIKFILNSPLFPASQDPTTIEASEIKPITVQRNSERFFKTRKVSDNSFTHVFAFQVVAISLSLSLSPISYLSFAANLFWKFFFRRILDFGSNQSLINNTSHQGTFRSLRIGWTDGWISVDE